MFLPVVFLSDALSEVISKVGKRRVNAGMQFFEYRESQSIVYSGLREAFAWIFESSSMPRDL